jgi:hypothetical protein
MAEAMITIPEHGEAIGFESLTCGTGPDALTATSYTSQADVATGHMQRPMKARVAVLTVSVANIRFTLDGSTVSPTTGHQVVAGQTLVIQGCGKIAKFRMAAVSGSPVVDCLYTL